MNTPFAVDTNVFFGKYGVAMVGKPGFVYLEVIPLIRGNVDVLHVVAVQQLHLFLCALHSPVYPVELYLAELHVLAVGFKKTL